MKLLLALLSVFFLSQIHAEIEKSYLKPYIFFLYKRDSPTDYNYGAFHYVNVHNTMPKESVAQYYQSGLFHTWYRPEKIYGQEDYSRDKYGYHCMEGGAGYKPYLRFHSEETPQKFTTGAVAGGFGSYSNGPSQGSPAFNRSSGKPGLGWGENIGRYGAATLSNKILFPLDGLNLAEGTNNEMLGYGYYTLPLTDRKEKTSGKDMPSGNNCWTLFIQSENFSGPVCFFTPYHWVKYSFNNKESIGKSFDNSLLQVNSVFQRETNKLPAKKWTSENGDTYFRSTPIYMPCDDDMVGRMGTMPMTLDSTLWDGLVKWFKEGGEPVSPVFKESSIHIRENIGVNLAYTLDEKNQRVISSSFAENMRDKEPSTAALKWKGPLIEKLDNELVKLPEYFLLKRGESRLTPIPASEVPEESGLQKLRFPEDVKEDYSHAPYNSAPITTPLNPDYNYSNEITKAWTSPGPVAGPFKAELEDGSVATYYWYKFNEQPAILNAHMNWVERDLIQKRVELLHKHWNEVDQYFPRPEQPLVSLDKGLLLTPPKGLEIGYVPICVHQQSINKSHPNFPKK